MPGRPSNLERCPRCDHVLRGPQCGWCQWRPRRRKVTPPRKPRRAEAECRLCGRRFPVAARGRVPSQCPDCNRRASPLRPAEIMCRDCGCVVPVAAKGPVPERCYECSRYETQRAYRQRAAIAGLRALHG